MKKIGRLLILLTVLLVVMAVPAWADGPDDEVVFGSNYTLSAGQTIGDLFVYGGEVRLEEGPGARFLLILPMEEGA